MTLWSYVLKMYNFEHCSNVHKLVLNMTDLT